MTWDNIHIDHVKPVSKFNITNNIEDKELLQCCHYTNLQPLFADENLRKSNKWSEKEDIFWRENIIEKSLL